MRLGNHPKAIIVTLLAVSLMLSACSEEEGYSESEDQKGAFFFSVDFQKDLVRKTEELTLECMKNEGYEYSPVDPESVINDTTVGVLSKNNSAEYIESEGYGITQGLAGTEEEVVASEVTKADEALQSMTQEERQEYEEQRKICGKQSSDKVREIKGEFFAELPQEAQDLIEGIELGTTSEYVDATEEWSTCVADEGLGVFSSPQEAQDSIRQEIYTILEISPDGQEANEENKPEVSPEKIEEAKETEVTFAKPERSCFNETVGEITLKQLNELSAIMEKSSITPNNIFDK